MSEFDLVQGHVRLHGLISRSCCISDNAYMQEKHIGTVSSAPYLYYQKLDAKKTNLTSCDLVVVVSPSGPLRGVANAAYLTLTLKSSGKLRLHRPVAPRVAVVVMQHLHASCQLYVHRLMFMVTLHDCSSHASSTQPAKQSSLTRLPSPFQIIHPVSPVLI